MIGHLEIGVATLSSCPNCQSQLRVKSHGKNVRDVIIAHVICGDAQTNTPTDKQTDMENIKAIFSCVLRARPTGKTVRAGKDATRRGSLEVKK